jgi:flagellar biosynthetic protein FliQ
VTVELVVEIYRETLRTAALVAAPILGVAMGVGLVVSLVQTITSLNDQTVNFVPKAAAIALALGVGLPWFLRHLMSFLATVLTNAPSLGAGF